MILCIIVKNRKYLRGYFIMDKLDYKTTDVLAILNTMKDDITNGKLNGKAIEYLNYFDLSDGRTEDEIEDIKKKFVTEAKAYIREVCPGKLCIWRENGSIYISDYKYLDTCIDNAERFLVS